MVRVRVQPGISYERLTVEFERILAAVDRALLFKSELLVTLHDGCSVFVRPCARNGAFVTALTRAGESSAKRVLNARDWASAQLRR